METIKYPRGIMSSTLTAAGMSGVPVRTSEFQAGKEMKEGAGRNVGIGGGIYGSNPHEQQQKEVGAAVVVDR